MVFSNHCIPPVASAGAEKVKMGKISELFVYDNFNRVPAERVEAGDICAFTGLSDVGIGETVCPRDKPVALPTIEVHLHTIVQELQAACFCMLQHLRLLRPLRFW